MSDNRDKGDKRGKDKEKDYDGHLANIAAKTEESSSIIINVPDVNNSSTDLSIDNDQDMPPPPPPGPPMPPMPEKKTSTASSVPSSAYAGQDGNILTRVSYGGDPGAIAKKKSSESDLLARRKLSARHPKPNSNLNFTNLDDNTIIQIPRPARPPQISASARVSASLAAGSVPVPTLMKRKNYEEANELRASTNYRHSANLRASVGNTFTKTTGNYGALGGNASFGSFGPIGSVKKKDPSSSSSMTFRIASTFARNRNKFEVASKKSYKPVVPKRVTKASRSVKGKEQAPPRQISVNIRSQAAPNFQNRSLVALNSFNKSGDFLAKNHPDLKSQHTVDTTVTTDSSETTAVAGSKFDLRRDVKHFPSQYPVKKPSDVIKGRTSRDAGKPHLRSDDSLPNYSYDNRKKLISAKLANLQSIYGPPPVAPAKPILSTNAAANINPLEVNDNINNNNDLARIEYEPVRQGHAGGSSVGGESADSFGSFESSFYGDDSVSVQTKLRHPRPGGLPHAAGGRAPVFSTPSTFSDSANQNWMSIIKEIKSKQDVRDRTLSRLTKSRRFRKEEKKFRREAVKSIISQGYQPSLASHLSMKSVIMGEKDLDGDELGAKVSKRDGKLEVGVFTRIGDKLDDVLNLVLDGIDWLPMDFKVVILILSLAGVLAYVVVYFTTTNTRDVTGLEVHGLPKLADLRD